MLNDKRKSQRRPMRYTAWVALEDGKLHGCVLADISDSGARLDVEESEGLPDKFMLLLSSKGSPRRRCRVIWRKPKQLGVTFERRLTNQESVTLAPRMDADSAAAKRETAEEV